MITRFFSLFFRAFSLHGRAVESIFANKIAWVFFVPVVLFILLGISGFVTISYISGYVADYIESAVHFDGWFAWLSFIINSFLIIFIRILLFVLFGFFSGYIALILLSPLLSYVSEVTEESITGQVKPFTISRLLHEAFRGVLVAMRSFFIQMGIFILIFLFSFFPLIGPLLGGLFGSVLLFFISSYFYGFSFIDYTLERRAMKISEGARYINARKGAATGFGFLYTLILFIPFIGVFLASYFAIISTVAACLYVVEEDAKQINE